MKQKKILIADDEILVHEMITIVLSSDEFEIIHAYDGQETVDCIENEQPDLIVLDIMMPFKDGRDICRDLKLNSKTKDIIILMLSAKDAQFDRVTGLELGADDYMTKPFTANHLASQIKKMFEKI